MVKASRKYWQKNADYIAHAQSLSLAVAQRALPSRSTTHQVSYFCLGKWDVICTTIQPNSVRNLMARASYDITGVVQDYP